MRDGAVDVAGADRVAGLQADVEHIEGKAGAGERLGAAAQRHLVAARHRLDAEPALERGEILVELGRTAPGYSRLSSKETTM